MTYLADPDTGHFLPAEGVRLAEILRDYDPALSLMWIPPENRELADTHPFAIVHTSANGKTYTVCTLKADELDHRALAKVFMADNHKQGSILAHIEAMERAQQVIKMKKQMEEMEEANERAAAIFRSPLHTYRLGKGKVIRG